MVIRPFNPGDLGRLTAALRKKETIQEFRMDPMGD
jgi:hypothetical protein